MVNDRRLRHLHLWIEGNEPIPPRHRGESAARCGAAHGRVDRVEPAVRTRELRPHQDIRFARLSQRDRGCHGQLVLRQRTRLVHAQHVHASRFVDGRKPCGQHTALSKCSRTDSRRQCEGGGQRNRNRRQDGNQSERNDFGERQLDVPCIRDQKRRKRAIDAGEIHDNSQHGLLLRTGDMRRAHKLGGAPELGMRPGRDHLGHGFPPADQRSGKRLMARLGLDRHGLAREHGLIELHRTLADPCVGWHDATKRQLDNVTRDKICRRQDRPSTIAQD